MPKLELRPSDPHELLTVSQVADLLQIDRGQVIGWIRNIELKAIDISKRRGPRPRWRIRRSDLDAFLARRSTVPTPKLARKRKRRKQAVAGPYPES